MEPLPSEFAGVVRRIVEEPASIHRWMVPGVALFGARAIRFHLHAGLLAQFCQQMDTVDYDVVVTPPADAREVAAALVAEVNRQARMFGENQPSAAFHMLSALCSRHLGGKLAQAPNGDFAKVQTTPWDGFGTLYQVFFRVGDEKYALVDLLDPSEPAAFPLDPADRSVIRADALLVNAMRLWQRDLRPWKAYLDAERARFLAIAAMSGLVRRLHLDHEQLLDKLAPLCPDPQWLARWTHVTKRVHAVARAQQQLQHPQPSLYQFDVPELHHATCAEIPFSGGTCRTLADAVRIYTADSSQFNVYYLLVGIMGASAPEMPKMKGNHCLNGRRMAALADGIDQAMDACAKVNRFFAPSWTLYRFVDYFVIGDRDLFGMKPPYVIQNTTTCSTTINPDVAFGFYKPHGCLMVLHVPADYTRYVACENMSDYSTEKEIIMPAGSEFLVHDCAFKQRKPDAPAHFVLYATVHEPGAAAAEYQDLSAPVEGGAAARGSGSGSGSGSGCDYPRVTAVDMSALPEGSPLVAACVASMARRWQPQARARTRTRTRTRASARAQPPRAALPAPVAAHGGGGGSKKKKTTKRRQARATPC